MPRSVFAGRHYTMADFPPRWSPPVAGGERVYFVRAGLCGGPIKIGFSANVQRRISELELLSSEALDLLVSVPGGRIMEHTLHCEFQEHRIRREWFRPVDRIVAYIRSCQRARRKALGR